MERLVVQTTELNRRGSPDNRMAAIFAIVEFVPGGICGGGGDRPPPRDRRLEVVSQGEGKGE
ncbi:MAG: hypothetical protein LBC30_02505, partial [Puniceicoccales bacterium]|nr:hypothetical protein [Puniceicoccales bacterium]